MYVDECGPCAVASLYLTSFGRQVLAERRVQVALLKVSHTGRPGLAVNTLLLQLGFDEKHGRSSISLSTTRGIRQRSGRDCVHINRV